MRVKFCKSVLQALVKRSALIAQIMNLTIGTYLEVIVHTRLVVVVDWVLILLINLTVVPATLILVGFCS